MKHNPYEDTNNFTSRLTVETQYPDKTVDHRTREFYDREYSRNNQADRKPATGMCMDSVTEAPKPKPGIKQRRRSKADQDLEKANSKDLSKRNIK